MLNCDKSVVVPTLNVSLGLSLDLSSCDWTGFDMSYKFDGGVFTELQEPGYDYYVRIFRLTLSFSYKYSYIF